MAEHSLRSSRIETDGYPESLQDYSVRGSGAQVVFVDLAKTLVTEIEQATYVVGCAAWLTHTEILHALAKKAAASIIVQKEDFLRPDVGGADKESLRRRYRAVKPLDSSYFWACEDHDGGLLGKMNTCGNAEFGIRCCGIASSKRNEVRPRMHHKFAVFLNAKFVPYRVWTGSYNWTNNAESSFENAIVIDDKLVVSAYFDEFQQIAALSESLDWTSEYVEPEYRIGT